MEEKDPIEEIVDEQLEAFDELVARSKQFKTLTKSIWSDYIVKYDKYEGTMLTLASVTATGLTIKDIEDFLDPENFAKNMRRINDIITWKRLPDENGAEVWFNEITTPFGIADRSQFAYLVRLSERDGTMKMVSTSKGTEKIVK